MDEEVEKYLAALREAKAEEEEDIYCREMLEENLEDDRISIFEEGFMVGYLEG